jgi:hypothetical protein
VDEPRISQVSEKGAENKFFHLLLPKKEMYLLLKYISQVSEKGAENKFFHLLLPKKEMYLLLKWAL